MKLFIFHTKDVASRFVEATSEEEARELALDEIMKGDGSSFGFVINEVK